LGPPNARPREREGRIEGHRLLVVGQRPPETYWIIEAFGREELLAAKERVISGQIGCWTGRELLANTVSECHVERLCHLFCDVRLHLEDVGQ